MNGLKVNIPSMFLEEESSGIVSSTSSSVTLQYGQAWNTSNRDRYRSLHTKPKGCERVALYIGTLLRLTGTVQRGIGSIRQDVNLSIKDGARVEIKGVQELWIHR